MKITGCFPGKYLKSADLEGPVAVTIKRIVMEKMDRSNDEKPVVYFQEMEQGLVLNVTNSKKITSLLGTDETDEWVGKQICLYPTVTDFAGDEVDCIRVRDADGIAPWEQ